jgi:crossover junction endodeoxyribonuclease RusA
MLITAADRAELLHHVESAEASGRADHPLVQMLRRIAKPKGMLQVTLPYPISANRYWQTRVLPARDGKPAMAITYVSKEAKAYKESVAWLMRAAGVRQAYQGRVAVHLALYPHRPLDWKTRVRKDPCYWADTVQRLDLDNCRKVVTDSLVGVVFADDKAVCMDGGEVMEPDGREACVVLTLWPLIPAATQASLMAPEPESLTAPPKALAIADYDDATPF